MPRSWSAAAARRLGLKTAAFRDWLIGGYLKACRRVPSDWAIRRALSALEATARFEGDTPSIFVRVGHDGSGSGSPCYVDMADPGGQAIRIGPEGWTVVDNPCVHFRRRQAYLPLPTPSREGSIDLLRPYVNLNDRDFRLLIVWMAAALRPVGPYPVLAIYGDQGSTKTTLAKVTRMLIDPHARSLRAQPRSTRSLMAAAVNVWLLAYDNLGVLPDWLSDGLCLLSTGGTFDGKTSLANDEGSVIHVQRPVILNGMEEFVARGDLADRSVFLHLPPIATTKRRCEIEFWAAFQQDYPRILGGLFDAVAGGMREMPSVRLTALPRMADFAAFAEAVGRSLGWPADTAISDYNDNRREASMSQLEDSPLAAFLLDLGPDYLNNWSGSPSLLYKDLTSLAGNTAESPRWPKSPAALTVELRRIAPQLAVHGILAHSRRSHNGRIWTVTRDRKVANEDVDLRNPMSDEPIVAHDQFGLKPNDPENRQHPTV